MHFTFWSVQAVEIAIEQNEQTAIDWLEFVSQVLEYFSRRFSRNNNLNPVSLVPTDILALLPMSSVRPPVQFGLINQINARIK